MQAKLFSAFCALAILCTLTAQLQADQQVVKKQRVKVVVAEDDSEPQIVDLDGEDLEIGESRQIFTESGKEILISRSEEGLNVTVDGEAIDVGALHEGHGHGGDVQVHRKVIKHLADGDQKTMVFVGKGGDEIDIQEVDVQKIIAGHGGKAHRVFISEDGETVDLKGIEDLKWVGPHIGMGGPGLAEHLETSGAFDDLSPEQRQKILDSIESYHQSRHSGARVMVIETEETEETDSH